MIPVAKAAKANAAKANAAKANAAKAANANAKAANANAKAANANAKAANVKAAKANAANANAKAANAKAAVNSEEPKTDWATILAIALLKKDKEGQIKNNQKSWANYDWEMLKANDLSLFIMPKVEPRAEAPRHKAPPKWVSTGLKASIKRPRSASSGPASSLKTVFKNSVTGELRVRKATVAKDGSRKFSYVKFT